MKKKVLFFYILGFNARSEVFQHKLSQKEVREITIVKLGDFHANEACLRNKIECQSLISNSIKVNSVKDAIVKTPPHFLGNPASAFCITHKGKPEILHDKKNNEYDYCVLDGKYFIDSWDFYAFRKK